MDTREIAGKEYAPRIVDEQVQEWLGYGGALILEGARGCGKTMTGLHHSNSHMFLDTLSVQQLAQVNPEQLLIGDAPRLLDEWQLLPQVWNEVRRAVDHSYDHGRFILTGSAVPPDDITRHSGAGRFLHLRQRTMTWLEKGIAKPQVSLRDLLAGKKIAPDFDTVPFDTVLDGVMTPGFPALVHESENAQWVRLNGYVNDTVRVDIPRMGETRQSPEVLRKLIESLARLSGSELRYATIAEDLARVAPNMAQQTLSSIVELLQRIFILELVPAYTPNLLSRARLRTSSKVHLVDPALAAVVLGAKRHKLADDLKTLGNLFESAVVHDLLVMTETLGGEVRHYRDSNGYEIDVVLTFPDGEWAAVEVKLGGGQIAGGAERLRAAVAQIDAERPPAFMAVVTGTGYTADLGGGMVTFPLARLSL